MLHCVSLVPCTGLPPCIYAQLILLNCPPLYWPGFRAAVVLLIFRYCISQMDVPARQTYVSFVPLSVHVPTSSAMRYVCLVRAADRYVALVVASDERSAAAGITSLVMGCILLGMDGWEDRLGNSCWRDAFSFGCPVLHRCATWGWPWRPLLWVYWLLHRYPLPHFPHRGSSRVASR